MPSSGSGGWGEGDGKDHLNEASREGPFAEGLLELRSEWRAGSHAVQAGQGGPQPGPEQAGSEGRPECPLREQGGPATQEEFREMGRKDPPDPGGTLGRVSGWVGDTMSATGGFLRGPHVVIGAL